MGHARRRLASTHGRTAAALTIVLTLGACGGGGSADTTAGAGGQPGGASDLSPAAQLGAQIFADQTLSASGKQSCATCHVARFAFAADPTDSGPDHGLPVPLGGPNMDEPGFRNTPSLMYLSFSPAFYFDSDGNPNGGFFRDGRAATLTGQAMEPFTTPFEMANADAAEVIEKLKTRPYLPAFESLYGTAVLADPQTALQRMGQAIAAFESEDPQFHPFTSKYDFWLNKQAELTAQEQRGLELFNDPSKANCAACHPSTSADGTQPPLFTDFSFDNLGVPRNAKIAANAGAAYYDLGICGPLRDNGTLNLSGICGQFKVPTLRNIALTAPYFHNGRFATLAEAIGFYVRRDTNPDEFYPVAADGAATKFDDLPAAYGGQFPVYPNVPGSDAGSVGNVNTQEIPYNRVIGDQPALSPAQINDLIAFLCTLTDGYDPANPSALVLPAQCQAAVRPAMRRRRS